MGSTVSATPKPLDSPAPKPQPHSSPRKTRALPARTSSPLSAASTMSTIAAAAMPSVDAAAPPRSSSASVPPVPRLDDLPRDLLLNVLRHLSPRDIIVFASVSRAARRVASSDDCWAVHLPEGLRADADDDADTDADADPAGLYSAAIRLVRGYVSRADGSSVGFLIPGDRRSGFVRVSVPPGNECVAHLAAPNEPVLPYAQYWTRHSEREAPGHSVLRLRSVCWLDARSSFSNLPNGLYTFSWNIMFSGTERDTSEGFYRIETGIFFKVELRGHHGETVREIECGRAFFLMGNDVNSLNKWLRLDVGLISLTDVPKVLLIAYHTENSWKRGISFARCDAVRSPVVRIGPGRAHFPEIGVRIVSPHESFEECSPDEIVECETILAPGDDAPL